jgi:hypothetical protein
LSDRAERARTSAIILLAPSASVAPTPIDPSAPAFATAAASAGEDTPAIGAWTIGSSIANVSSKLMHHKYAWRAASSIPSYHSPLPRA